MSRNGAFSRAHNKARTGVLVFLSHPEPPGASGGLRGPLGASGGLRGLRGPGGLGRLRISRFFGPVHTCLAHPKFQYLPGLLQYRPGQGCSQDHGQKTLKAKVRFRVTNNLVSHSKGERSPRRGSCPSTWRCSSRSTNFLGLHSSSKRWCE